jgi:hypothetical protein
MGQLAFGQRIAGLSVQPVRGHRGVIDGAGLRYRLVTLPAGGDSRRPGDPSRRLPSLLWYVAIAPLSLIRQDPSRPQSRELDQAIGRAVRFLRGAQLSDGSFLGTRGGWGEHHSGCARGVYVPHPEGQPAMTSWALLAPLDATGDDTSSPAVERGVHWLCGAQRADGSCRRAPSTGCSSALECCTTSCIRPTSRSGPSAATWPGLQPGPRIRCVRSCWRRTSPPRRPARRPLPRRRGPAAGR